MKTSFKFISRRGFYRLIVIGVCLMMLGSLLSSCLTLPQGSSGVLVTYIATSSPHFLETPFTQQTQVETTRSETPPVGPPQSNTQTALTQPPNQPPLSTQTLSRPPEVTEMTKEATQQTLSTTAIAPTQTSTPGMTLTPVAGVTLTAASTTTAYPTLTEIPWTQITGTPGILGKHIVRSGETLYMIGRAYGVDPMAIARTNNVENPNRISIDQVLWIPAVRWENIPPGPVAVRQFQP